MEFAELFSNFGGLFKVFSYWSILLIVGVTLVMIPINLLWKKLMKKDKLQRLRKVVSTLSVYVVALAAVAGFTWITSTGSYTFAYLSGATLSLGFCSQFLWMIIKLIRDYGFAKVAVYIAESIDWKKSLKEFGKKFNIDTKITDIIATEIENKYLADIETDAVKAFAENETAMLSGIQQKLDGFVKTEDLQEVAKGLFEMLRDSWKATPKVEEAKTAQ